MIKKIEKIDVDEAFKKIGKKISERRKSLRKKFPGISKKLNISINYLKYIEEGKVDKIPDHIPSKGFVKTYAKLLDVNIDDELFIIEQDINTADSVQKNKRSKIVISPKVYFIYFILFFIFILCLSYFFNLSNKNKEDNSFFGYKDKINIIRDTNFDT